MTAPLCIPGETWKPIPDFPGYEVSDHGRVQSYYRRITGGHVRDWEIVDSPQRVMKGAYNPKGYQFVNLRRDGLSYRRPVHQLILEAFAGPCPDGQETCHNDGNPRNNHLSNLRYDTHLANIQDAIAHGSPFGFHSKLSASDVMDIRTAYANGTPARQLAADYSLCIGTIHKICRGDTHKHLGGPRTRNRHRKLTAADGHRIRQAVRCGQTQVSQARKYGVSEATISRIMNGTRHPQREPA